MKGKAGVQYGAVIQTRQGVKERSRTGAIYTVEAYRDGKLLWREQFHNLITDEGCNDMLDKYWKGSSYTASHYVGLKGTGEVQASDTMSSHPNWTEVTDYDESSRPALVLGSVSNKQVDNSANKATFTINNSVTVAGAFITTDSTKGGTTGLLISAGDFATARSLGAGDTLTVTVTLSQNDDGV